MGTAKTFCLSMQAANIKRARIKTPCWTSTSKRSPLVYEKREDVDKYAHLATFEEIAENDFNLNIPRYVDTFEEEEEIDIDAVGREIDQLETELSMVRERMARLLKGIEREGGLRPVVPVVDRRERRSYKSMRRREARLILGVDEDATTETIKSAFRRYALKHHPDRNPDNPVAEESFKKGAHAYRLLTGQEGADLDELLEQFEDIEQALDKMKQSFDEFGKSVSEGLDRIETKMSRMFKWTIFLMIFTTLSLVLLILIGF